MKSYNNGPLNIYVLPFISTSHLVPLCEIARLFVAHGHKITVITTPANVPLLHPSLSVHLIEFPAQEVGLPKGMENIKHANDLETAGKLYRATTIMQARIEGFVEANPPDCIISDMFYPWTVDLAARVGVPRLGYQGHGCFPLSLKEVMRPANPDAPHHHVKSDYEPFVVHGLPDKIVMTRAQLPDFVRKPYGFTQLMEVWREAERKSYGLIINGFYELEPAYVEHYKKIINRPIYHLGPVTLIHRNVDEKAERGHKATVDTHECLKWLDSKEPSSVLYVCFGSACRFPTEQLHEIACALASSKVKFIWVVHTDTDTDTDTDSKWVAPELEEEMEAGRGMIIRGWAPQVLILDHPAIGGFMTHCGWNSFIEGISAGLPFVTWPLYAEQFYNEKSLTQVLKIGAEAGCEEWNLWVDAGKKVVKREKIEWAVRRVMGGGEEAVAMRRRAKELGVMARKAVEEGGSSHRNLMGLIEELKRLREGRLAKAIA